MCLFRFSLKTKQNKHIFRIHNNHPMDEMNLNIKYSSFLFYAIHLYFITLFEVLFYLYYILPYEQQLLFGLFEFHSNQLTTKYNITITASDLYDAEKCRDDAGRIRRANTPLYSYCYYYIGVITICLISLFCYDVYLHVVKNGDTKITTTTQTIPVTMVTTNGLTKNTFSFSSVDMQDAAELGVKNTKDTKEQSIKEPEKREENSSNYWKESLFVAEFIRSLYFICFIGVFEYVFFYPNSR